jgi:NitT/TauT family transport system permease protein
MTFSGLVLLVAAWFALAALYPPVLVPSPLEVLEALLRLAVKGSLWHELGFTIVRLAVAFGLGATLGIGLGLLAGGSETAAALLRPPMSVAAAAPPISWIALALIWFGTGSLTPIIVSLLVGMPSVFAATMEGVRALDRDLLVMARSFGLRRMDLLRDFYLPALAPHLLSGLTVGATLTVRVGIMGEFLASSTGVGSAMALARTQLNTAEVTAWLLVALALLFAIEGLLLRPLRRHVAAWRREA